jgi:hypothetical protein
LRPNSKPHRYLFYTAIVIISSATSYLAVRNTPVYIDEWAYITLAHFLIHGRLATLTSFQSLYNSLGHAGPTVIFPWGPEPTGQPWLDHPLLVPFMLIPFLLLDLPPRILPILLSGGIGACLYFLFRRKIALAVICVGIWVLYLATNPILSMLFLDVGVSFFSILTLVITNEYLNGSHRRSYLYAAAIVAGLAAASKESGLAAVAYLGVFLLYVKFKDKESIISNLKPFVLSVSISAAWYVYALLTEPTLFLALLKINSHRYALPGGAYLYNHIPNFFYTQANLSNEFLITFGQVSPLMILGIIGILYLAVRAFFNGDLRLPVFFATCYVSFILATDVYFHVMIPLFPMYCIGTSAIIYDVVTKGKDLKSSRIKGEMPAPKLGPYVEK